jgi:hypothetical protein
MNSLIAPLNMVNNAAKSAGAAFNNSFKNVNSSFNTMANSAANTASNVVANMANTANTFGNTAANVANNVGEIISAPLNSNLITGGNSSNGGFGMWAGILIFLVLVGVFIGILYYFQQQLMDSWNKFTETVNSYFNPTPVPAAPVAPAAPTEEEKGQDQGQKGPDGQLMPLGATVNMEKILPGGAEVFNVSSNKFTYYDSAPLCKALGAELATYEQVKDAWSKGADWCNYGWVKGQMAVYPTGEETYAKLQLGPEEQRTTCGIPGVNGGYFDNPELRFGVNCYGKKPAQKQHDTSEQGKGAPISPDALAFDKKVNQYKSDADNIGVNPFNTSRW